MFHALTPNLGDPLLLAEASLPALQEVLGIHRGEAKVTYDPTLKNPVRIRPAPGTILDAEEARNRLSEMIGTLSTAAAPFEVSFLKARVRQANREPYPLDLMRVAAGLQLFFLRAQHHNELIGDTLEVDVSLSMPKGDAKDVRAYVDCRLAGDKSADREKQQALEEYYAAVQAYWSRLCRTDLGCWALESGIGEFRMTARVLVDPREALSAIGLSRPAAA
ncbi:hypothetical protein AAFN88_12140 [Pelagibius sp. CAU 1746]|uniref:hypothetical protein n=1 Tax=Pelagibius sp. CAU 1746 TaxID=3140370 RepID=UPI00325AE08C